MNSSIVADLQPQLGALLDHLPAGVVVHSADGRILHANRYACELIGLNLDQLHGIGSDAEAWRFLCADGAPLPAQHFPVNVVLSTGRPVSQLILGTQTAPGAAVRWALCNAYPEFDASNTLSRVVVCFTDCTALKEAEEGLQKSEERLRLALEGSTDAPWDYDLLADEIYYSDRWWTMLGFAPGELLASPGLWLELMHPDDKGRVTDYLGYLLDSDCKTYSFEFSLRHRNGHYLPILSRGFVSRDEHRRPLRLSGTNTDLTERKLAEQRIYELANFDHLTGLPNRRLLLEVLDKALARSARSGQTGAVVFMDLDNFKLLNDTIGHDIGDLLLRQVSDRLRHALRHSDQLARLGGDEFVLLIEELGDDAQEAVSEARRVLEKVQSALRKPYDLDGRAFSSTPSMGVALFDAAITNVETLLKQADLAMYRAKSAGRNTIRFFDPDMQASAERQVALEHAMREGLAKREFVLYCQPQFDRHGRLVGAEVLVRWRRSDGQVVGPAEFIDLAESSGFIVPLGHYVLEESCRTLARWRGDRTLAGLDLAVNISVCQLRNNDFTRIVTGILETSGAPPNKLCLELTESVFAENQLEIIGHMAALRQCGVYFSLDDFGTGYSSLAYLQRFPLKALKIDRSFVQEVHVNHDSSAIVEAIIALAHKLGLETVAEGVELEAQRQLLVEWGCGVLQGYLLGRPIPIQEFERIHGGGDIDQA